jgi:hypothetical protein
MRRSLIALSLVGLLMQATETGFAQAAQGSEESVLVRKARAAVAKASTTAKVTVVLNDNTKLKGFILNAGDDCFTLVDSRTSKSNCIKYADVLRVQRQRPPAWRSWVALAAAVAVPFIILAAALHSDY